MTRREQYMVKALAIFKQEGLRMSLEELAEKMGITKKTLYNHFNSKEELLQACIKDVFSGLHESMLSLNNTCRNPVDCMLYTFKSLSVYFRDHSPVFIGDLQRLYPEMVTDKHTSGYGQFREKIILNIQRGIAEGVYRNDMDVTLISKYMVHSIFGFFFYSVVSDNSFSAANYFDTIAQFNLRAMVNEKGMELLIKSQIYES